MDVTNQDVTYNDITNKLARVHFTLEDGSEVGAADIMKSTRDFIQDEDNFETVWSKVYSLSRFSNNPMAFLIGYVMHAIATSIGGKLHIETEVATKEKIAAHLSAAMKRSAENTMEYSEEVLKWGGLENPGGDIDANNGNDVCNPSEIDPNSQ